MAAAAMTFKEPLMLSPEERGLIRSCVGEIARLSGRLIRSAVTAPATAGSIASANARSELNVISIGGGSIVQEANFSILLAVSSGADHVRAYLSALSHGQGSVAMGTLVRGAVEAFAKSHYLLSADSTSEFIARHVAISVAELRYPLRYSRFEEWDGRITDGSDYPAVYARILSQLGLPRITPPGEQEKVASLLSAAISDGEVGGEVYSQLSGAAHAVTSALGMYLRRDGSAEFGYPAPVAFEHVGYLFAGVTVVAEQILRVFGLDQADHDRWLTARGRAEVALHAIRAAVLTEDQ